MQQCSNSHLFSFDPNNFVYPFIYTEASLPPLLFTLKNACAHVQKARKVKAQ